MEVPHDDAGSAHTEPTAAGAFLKELEADDPFFGKPLLHVQSFGWGIGLQTTVLLKTGEHRPIVNS